VFDLPRIFGSGSVWIDASGGVARCGLSAVLRDESVSAITVDGSHVSAPLGIHDERVLKAVEDQRLAALVARRPIFCALL
jgi:hypothetical protein